MVLLFMVLDPGVYADYVNLIGFRVVFLIVLVITLVETGWSLMKQVGRVLSRQGQP